MPIAAARLTTRISSLNAFLRDKSHRQLVDAELHAAAGDWLKAQSNLATTLPKAVLQRLEFAHSIAEWSGDNISVVTGLAARTDLSNLRDVASHFNVEKLAALVDPHDVPETTAGATAEQRKKHFAVALRQKLFAAQPTAVLHRMVLDKELPITDQAVRYGISKFLNNQPQDFNVRTTSIYNALKVDKALDGIDEAQLPTVITQLKILQRVTAISPVPEAVAALMKSNLTSAFQVGEMTEAGFLRMHGESLGEETARQIYTNAINTRIRNEHALITMRESIRGSGLAIIDGQEAPEARLARLQRVADEQNAPLNLELLFGSIDYCECEECNSVYSPAAYFVELLQYLRNNNLGPDPANPRNPNPGIRPDPKDISNTPLEKLFRRRPDLGCLELTCHNAFTVLPYIDLVNEVMESFVVHLKEYEADPNNPKQAKLEAFNVEDETTNELLAQPQHVNYKAYCILKHAVYPFTLPYHQPIDAIRIFLNYLGTSRYELLDTFRSPMEPVTDPAITPNQNNDLKALHKSALDRAVDAEFLGLTEEEYIILTKEAFWQKAYFEITEHTALTDAEYRDKIRVKPVYAYYGYEDSEQADMADLTQEKGLTFVKKQFLPRTGLLYVDLVELLKTRFINPNYPQGAALAFMQALHFSYRFLQTLLVNIPDKETRFAKLIKYLETDRLMFPLIAAQLNPDPCKTHQPDWCLEHGSIRNWVHCWFEKIGKLIVLESGEGSSLPVYGPLFLIRELGSVELVAILRQDGVIVSADGQTVLGSVGSTLKDGIPLAGPVKLVDGRNLTAAFGDRELFILDDKQRIIGTLFDAGVWSEWQVAWLPPRDTCNLDKVRLVHLDGSALKTCEYDRIHRFIRLWRKLGWTIDEVDKALVGLSAKPTTHRGADTDPFDDDCGAGDGEAGDCCDDSNTTYAPREITPEFLHQLVAVRKLMEQTGLELIKLLSFRADISTAGEKSLYARLFLTHNLLGIDTVFQADANGNYFTQKARITDHVPVLMAALRLKADDIAAIMERRDLPDDLTLASVTALYRDSLLAKLLHVTMTELTDVIVLFGDPFASLDATLDLLDTWGRMEDAGFTFRHLNYLLRDHDDPVRPVAPTKKSLLQIAKTLYDGLNTIERDHGDIKGKDEEEKEALATVELVRAKAGLLYEPSVVEGIIGLLEGTTAYSTNAPEGLTIDIKDAPSDEEVLSKRVRYAKTNNARTPTGGLQVTGILSLTLVGRAKGLSSRSGWATAFDRLAKQPKNIFTDALAQVFPTWDAAAQKAKDKLLEPDTFEKDGGRSQTAPSKRLTFMRQFLPFLRETLRQRLIVSTISSATGLPVDTAIVLLCDVLKVGTGLDQKYAIEVLEDIKEQLGETASWKGYLIPPSDDAFTFFAVDDGRPDPLHLNGADYPFANRQEDPNNVWFTNPTAKLKAGNLYWFEVSDRSAIQLQWKTSGSARSLVPTSVLLPDHASQDPNIAAVFSRLFKAAMLVNAFGLTADEVSFLQSHGSDFDGLDFNAVDFARWRRLEAYVRLRNSLPKLETTLLDLFTWAAKPDVSKTLSEQICGVTNWQKERLDKLLAENHFDLNHPEKFKNEVSLLMLQDALKVADKIGIDIDRLFEWAKPSSKFWPCHKIAEDIRLTVRSRFDQESWEQVVKPLNDQLRRNQREALVNYLVVQPILRAGGVIDADSLFEFFLIDVQMECCMETSRIKQAISSVQLFIQRCFLGFEDRKDGAGRQIGVSNNALDRSRWEWMQKYRVWEANRKVFLYPENWLDPHLRDDKSPFFKEFESELLQKDLNPQSISDATTNYLYKVDEVANMKVVGLFVENPRLDDNSTAFGKLHVFSRTRSAPYFYYYRYFNGMTKDWYPWEKVQVDVPNYEAIGPSGGIKENGSYVIPVVWNKRLLIFFPLFSRKTISVVSDGTVIEQTGNKFASTAKKPNESWEIKMGWSEYRNGKWTPKQISSDAVYQFELDVPHNFLPPVEFFAFVPRIHSIDAGSDFVSIEIWDNVPPNYPRLPMAFAFSGNHMQLKESTGESPDYVFDFHYRRNPGSNLLYSLQAINDKRPSYVPPLVNPVPVEPTYNEGSAEGKGRLSVAGQTYLFFHSISGSLLREIAEGGIDGVLRILSRTNDAEKGDAFGSDDDTNYHELKSAYSLYNWEVGFHAPMMLADRLLKSQQFEEALKTCQYVLNPTAEGTGKERFWMFQPFREVESENVLEKLFLSLQPNELSRQINEWRDKPFRPHVVARGRPSAYMKWVAMKYIDILIAYGDYYFRQNTLETIPLAIQYYVLASHIYGPRGQRIPKRGKILPQTYRSLLDKWDAFGNAMVELELIFPFSNQTTLPTGSSNGVVGLPNVFGFASSLYFCIPDNPKLRELRDTIDDRLFKIRHCQDIEGVFRKLPLFEPPIDPALLVQAAAQGISMSNVLNDLNSPMPNYRFNYLLQKALELCSELKALGNAFLSVKEKKDAESLSQLRAKHESSIHNLVMEVRNHQLEESKKSLEALQQSRKGPEYRLKHQLQLIGEDVGKLPKSDSEFSELPNQIEKPVDEGGLKLSRYEKEEMDKASAAADWQTGIGIVETLGSILNLIPQTETAVKPLGLGVGVHIGGINIGNSLQAVARGLRVYADHLSYQSTNAGRKGGVLRQLQDRVQQANNAGYEIKNVDKQITTQQIRISIAQQEINNQQKQIDNATEIEEYLRGKYTNEELYSWMEGTLRTLNYQAYTLAYDLAKKAERAFQFERGDKTSNFIQFGYWDAAHDGMLAGERLCLGLKQLEAAHQEKRGYDYEITKHISLRQLNPLALLQLKATGSCEIAVPEVLFDMDYPGHYMRRIKSVALSVPCVVGPFTSLNCTLRLTEHKFRTNSIAQSKSDYPEKTDETDLRFSTVNVPITSIALSTGQNDSGVFELNFRDERYIPFEGAGAISKWRIELPTTFRQFDYGSIADVVMHMRYTTVDGGDKLKKPAAESFEAYIKSVEELSREEGLFVILDLKNEFPNEWHRFVSGTANFVATVKRDHFPYFVQASSIKIATVQLYSIQSDKVQTATLPPSLDLDTLTTNLNSAAARAFELSLPPDSAVLVREQKANVFVLIKYSVG